MRKNRNHQPPKWATRWIEWYCRKDCLEDLLGDLHEYFDRNLEVHGPFRAKLIYILDSLKFFRSYTVKRPDIFNDFIHFLMIGNYLKISGRIILRNKLFSFINIVGLAISMSVGLLLIAFILDLFSYDQFHEKKNRIYRITNVETLFDGLTQKIPTTSIATRNLIAEQISGIENVSILKEDFSSDVKAGSMELPLKGFWAESSIFKIFTFPFIEGNPKNALDKPYSMVLTETSARKLFGDQKVLGKGITVDSVQYEVTGVIREIPFFSHLKFEALVSFTSLEQNFRNDPDSEKWTRSESNFVYVLLPEEGELTDVQFQLKALSEQQNQLVADHEKRVQLELLPLKNIVVGEDFQRTEGLHYQVPHMATPILWFLIGLTLIVIISACFNYTNLSIARSLRRFKEIGLRKAIGAGSSHVWQQFLIESIMISIGALFLSFLIFLFLRIQLFQMAPQLQDLVKLEISLEMILAFLFFSMIVGLIAGLFPAFFFAKVRTNQALKNMASIKIFNQVRIRRGLLLLQYTFTLLFITTTCIAYYQYKDILEFDLGFRTENILNIDLQGNNSEVLLKELGEIPEVLQLSRSTIVTGVGNAWGGFMKFQDPQDSVLVMTNNVDEHYLNLHDYNFIAGSNFKTHPTEAQSISEVIVNEATLKRFNIQGGDPSKSIGEEITFSNHMWRNQKMTIVGVIQDFHYGKINELIKPVAFMYWTAASPGTINVKFRGGDLQGTMDKIEKVWKKQDQIHPLKASLYGDSLEDAYKEYAVIIKIIGFLSLLTISIASMGLFGMVVFTTETRIKEIGIRKVLGASSENLIYILSRDFLKLIAASAFISLPLTYYFFKKFILTNFPYHQPIGIFELIIGFLLVAFIAFVMIGIETLKTARTNPAKVLRAD